MTDDFSDLPLFDGEKQSSGISFPVDLHPQPAPDETTSRKLILSTFIDLFLLGGMAALFSISLKLILSATPWMVIIAASVGESYLVFSLIILLSSFFWGVSPGMHVVGVRLMDDEGEIPGAPGILIWYAVHMISILSCTAARIPLTGLLQRRQIYTIDSHPG